ncbi:helix-turn-helix domain-containing protein [Thermopetrobacter sp. TC1]|uniref:helix-turn-helix domain-containing protein n=1 Tax=Thermopetrobacter sp. TC1 TaxID=1495045 RepID=UPI0018CCDF42|nr:helix-turn-helix domain-containing protein [Thermopetrobacter sp. TC1]
MAGNRTYEGILAALPEKRRQRILERTDALKREYRALQDLRRALGTSQVEVARRLGISQPSVAQMEKRTDWMLSTLASYVNALGGRLRLIVELPGQPPIHLNSIEDLMLPDEAAGAEAKEADGDDVSADAAKAAEGS